jgi:catechol-2,3-dioxygenase
MKVKQLAHIVLRVRDVEKSKRWYADVLGLKVMAEFPGRMAFLSSRDDVSHELGLMQISPDAPGPEQNRVGMYHAGWQLESLEDVVNLKSRLEAKGVNVVGVGDHGISIGIYVTDPDGNELEFFYELPPEEWPEKGELFSGRFPKPVDVY